jgi:hypothetical protein
MIYPPLSLIRPSIRRRLRRLAGGDPRTPGLDRAHVEAALHRQMRYLGIGRPIAWQDGLAAARRGIIAHAVEPLADRVPDLARAAARATARRTDLRLQRPGSEPARRSFLEDAKRATYKAVSDAVEEPIESAVLDPVHAQRVYRPWNARWGDQHTHAPGRADGCAKARGALARLYLACPQPRYLTGAVNACNNAGRPEILTAPAPPSFAADWMRAWMIAWAEILENPVLPDDPYRAAEQAAWDTLLEEAGIVAGREALEAIRAAAFGAFVEKALDPVYGAWCALDEANAGAPEGDLFVPWRALFRSFWLPFVQMAVSGLALYWATPEMIVCLPLPALFLRGRALDRADGPAVIWPDGESHWFRDNRLLTAREIPAPAIDPPGPQ